MTWSAVLASAVFTIPKTVAYHSVTLDFGGTAPQAIGAIVGGSDSTMSTIGNWDVDGDDLTFVAGDAVLGDRGSLHHNLAPTSHTGVQNVGFNRLSTSGYTYQCAIFAIWASGTLDVIAGPTTQNNAAGIGPFTLDSGTAEGVGFAMAHGQNPTAYAGSTLLVGSAPNELGAAYETASTTGSRSFGLTTASLSGGAAVIYSTGLITARPSVVNIPVTLTSPAISGPANFVAYPDPIVIPMTVNDLPGVRAEWPRVLPLVGEEAEMSGRVAYPTGLTSPVLSHAGARPVWVEADSLVSAVTHMVPLTTTGAAGDPELVWDDNDELVMTEYNE
jgi:hypothetical protein